MADESPRSLAGRQLWLLGGRLVAATLLLGGHLLAGPVRGDVTHGVLRGLIAATFAMSLAVAVALPRSRRPGRLAWLQVGWDLALVTGLVTLFGGATSQFSFLYGVVVLAAAMVIGPRATQLTAAASIVLYAAVGLGLANDWIARPGAEPAFVSQEELALSLLRNVVGLVLVGLLASALAERLERAGGRLREAAQSAEGHARFNEDIMRSLGSGLLTMDPEGRVRRVNPAGAAMLGAESPEALRGRDARELLPLPTTIHHGERGEGEARRLDGQAFAVGFSCSPLRGRADEEASRAAERHGSSESGERESVLGTLVLFQDLTELNQLRDKAERAERLAALGRLSAGLAHEIRNPLGSIAGSVELVMDAPGIEPEDRRLLELVLGETDRLNDLVTTMLDVGRPRAPELVGVDLGRLAEEVAGLAKGSAEVRVTVEGGEPVRVRADPGQLRQVLWNLVKNALQFSPPGGVVAVRVGWGEDARPTVSVSDEGPGIAPEDQARLFDMFFSKRRHGVGLGLALVRQIVDAHDGAIEVDSAPGEGATFTVRLPPEGAAPLVRRASPGEG